MKKVMIFLFMGIMSASMYAQDAAKQDSVAKIKFKSEVIDYGEIIKGSDGIRKFEFTNTGNVPLVISKVHSSCGCTIPKKPEKPIAPGASDVIEVKYDTKRVGPIRKTITVYSNADEPTKAIKIKGTILDDKKASKPVAPKKKTPTPVRKKN